MEVMQEQLELTNPLSFSVLVDKGVNQEVFRRTIRASQDCANARQPNYRGGWQQDDTVGFARHAEGSVTGIIKT